MKVRDRGYSTPRSITVNGKTLTFVCDPHYSGQYLVPCEDNDGKLANLSYWPFSPDSNSKYFLQYVRVMSVDEWRKTRGTYHAMMYGDNDGIGNDYIGVLMGLTGDEEDLVWLEKKFEQAAKGDFNDETMVCYCDLLLFDKDGNPIKYKEVCELK